MVKFTLSKVKDLGLQRIVSEALPYAVVGGAWKGSFDAPHDEITELSHIVPAGQQLKILFLRVWTQKSTGAVFSIEQTNPAEGEEGYPVVGSVPEGVRDYPMLEAAGAEVLHGSLKDPVHVLEGKVDFKLHDVVAGTEYYGIVYWGVEKQSD